MNESATTDTILEPMDLRNTTEFDELLRQRIKCGWNCSPSQIEAWREATEARTLSMFWIVPPSHAQILAPQRYAGHIAMHGKSEPADDKLTSKERLIQHISNLFILPERRSGGLGKAAVQTLEKWAKVEPYGSPECQAITLNTLSRRYTEDEGEEWRGLYARICESLDIEIPAKGSSNEDWYARMGYVKWTEEPLYPVMLDGKKIMLIAAWLKKELA